jgi:hypothetical protein
MLFEICFRNINIFYHKSFRKRSLYIYVERERERERDLHIGCFRTDCRTLRIYCIHYKNEKNGYVFGNFLFKL